MERFSNKTIHSLEEALGIPFLSNFPKSRFESSNHIVWTHPDFDWNPKDFYFDVHAPIVERKKELDLVSEINIIVNEILSEIKNLNPHYLKRMELERKKDLPNLCGIDKEMLDQDPLYRNQVDKIIKISNDTALLYSTTKVLYLARKISKNNKNIINLGFSSPKNVDFLKILINECGNPSNMTFFLTSNALNGFFEIDEQSAKEENYVAQYQKIKSIAKQNGEVFLLGGYAGECVLNTLQDLYNIFDTVNVMYDFCRGRPQNNSSFSLDLYPNIIQKILERSLDESSLNKKVKVIVNGGKSFFEQDYKVFFNPRFLEYNRGHTDIKKYAHKLKLVSEKHANRLLQINT
jgi:hypothetical protein